MYSILLNIGITLAQVVGGMISGSLALISDAVHNLTDVFSLVISYAANTLAGHKASVKKTFGYKRAEVLAAFVNALSLIVIAIFLFKEAIERFMHPKPIESGLVILLSVIGIVANGLSVLLLKDQADKNLNLKSAYLHLFTDMLASIAVLVGGLLMYYFKIFWIDTVLTLIISMYLVYVGYDLLKKSTRMLMLFTPEHLDIKALVEKVNAMSGVKQLHHVHLWCVNEEELHLEGHLDLSRDLSMSQFNELQQQIEQLLLKEYGIHHITLQPEYNVNDEKDLIVQD